MGGSSVQKQKISRLCARRGGAWWGGKQSDKRNLEKRSGAKEISVERGCGIRREKEDLWKKKKRAGRPNQSLRGSTGRGSKG